MAVEPIGEIAGLLIHASGKAVADGLQRFTGLERFAVEILRCLRYRFAQLGGETGGLAFNGLGHALKTDSQHVVHGGKAFIDVLGALEEGGVNTLRGGIGQFREALAFDIQRGHEPVGCLGNVLLDVAGAVVEHAIHALGRFADGCAKGGGTCGELCIERFGAFGDRAEEGGRALVEA